jgi:pyridinium-3,5-biscarboxylic acid mononucleotide sulfurtransferase
MPTPLAEKLEHLRAIIHQLQSVLVAYSGGVDSALVLAVAVEQLGSRALACIGVSPSYPQRERDAAVALAAQLGAAYRIIETTEHEDPRYAANPDNRCYFCKANLFDHLREIAAAEGWNAILDGNNVSDMTDDRPGRLAGAERGVRSPLIEAQISKADVRELSRRLKLPVWDKPAMPCLSSRVPHGTLITPGLLGKIEQAENALVELGFGEFRVRHHGDVARIQLPPHELGRAFEHRTQIVARVKACGYRFVTLDLSDFVRADVTTSAGN